jgi:hypothetical protein
MKSLRMRVVFVVLGLAAALAPAFMLLPPAPTQHATTLIAYNSPYPPPPPG